MNAPNAATWPKAPGRVFAPSGHPGSQRLRQAAAGVALTLGLATLGLALASGGTGSATLAATATPAASVTSAVPGPAALPAEPEGYVLAVRGLISGGAQALAALATPAGAPALAVGFADRVEVGWAGAGRAGFFPVRTVAVASGPTALAAADLDGSGQPDLVVGTGGAGSLIWVRDVLTGGPVLRASGFLFGPAHQVMPAELDGVRPMELVAVNAAGELFVFSAGSDGTYRRVWGSAEPRVLAAAAGDLDGNGTDELAVGLATGEVRVLRWAAGRLEQLAVGYPWGEPVALAVAPAVPRRSARSPGTGAINAPAAAGRLVVATTRRVAYAYRLDGRHLVAEWLGGHDRLALQWMRSAALAVPLATAEVPSGDAGNGAAGPAPGTARFATGASGTAAGAANPATGAASFAAGPATGVIFEGTGLDGIQVFRLDVAGVSLLAQARWPGRNVRFVRLSGGVLVVLRPDGSVDQLQTVPAGYLDLQVNGRTVRPAEISWEGDIPLLAVGELARLAGLQVSHPPGTNSALLADKLSWVRVEADNPRVLGPHRGLYLPQPPVLRGEQLYVPPEVLQALGWVVRYEPEYRRLRLRRPERVQGDTR